MRTSWLTAVVAALVLTAPPSPAWAQQSTCNQVRPSTAHRTVVDGNVTVRFSDPVRVVCADGVQLEADSAVMTQATGTVELWGSVLYRDGDRQLTADWARYIEPSDVLYARNDVVLTDLSDGSVITGDDFEYYRPTEERLESRMIMRGQRPHAVLRSTPGADPTADDTGVSVWGRRLEMLGETVFLARIDVEFQRHDLRGAADAVRFDQTSETMSLSGNAHVETDDYRLDGEQIDADMRGDTLREVNSQRNAALAAEEMTVRGANIRIGFADGQPERVEAWNPAAMNRGDDAADEEPAQRAIAISTDFQLRADSIDARSVDGRIREVRAVGRAYGEREADTLAVHLPDVLARDWIQGDTIIAFFVDEDAPGVETMVGQVGIGEPDAVDVAALRELAAPPEDAPASRDAVLDRIEVIGGSSAALSFQLTQPAEGEARPGINFVAAKRITLFMKGGEVDHVTIDGPLEGVHLEPAAPRAPSPAGATIAARRTGS
jgi:lipopolysaccharide export system protein LptA